MKNKNRFQNQNQKSISVMSQLPMVNLNQMNKHNGESTSAKSGTVIGKSNQTPVGSARENVAKMAYQIYQHEGCPSGRDLAHWLEAESQLAAVSPKSLKSEVTVTTETTVKNEILVTAKTGESGNRTPAADSFAASRK